ncbi:hypothetical protein diail_4013 [Diaporthe ilicicola]|nr:hypothetical protein diail_4013 [Diaporthe ilicicola]
MDPFVSREWSVPATSSADVGWDRRPRTHPLRRHSQRRRRQGLASLADLAANVAAANIQDIDPSHLCDLSPRSLQLVLKHLHLG